jgi:hypothetical protein
MRAESQSTLSVCEAAVIAAYSAARAQGRTRYEAFVRAVQAYREQCQCPDLAANGAGPEVARILLATARSGGDGTGDLQSTEGLEYVGPA